MPRHITAFEHMFRILSYSALGVGCDCPVSSSTMGEAAVDGQRRKPRSFPDDKATLSNAAGVPGRRATGDVPCAGVVLGEGVP